MTCILCGREMKRLGLHLKFKHDGMSSNEYYTRHVNEIRPLCCCGKTTQYLGPSKGFSSHCSTTCSSLDPKVRQKLAKTSMEKYGTESPNSSKSVSKKRSKSQRKFLSKPENFKRVQKSRYKYYEVVVDGKKFEVQGYERFFLAELKQLGLSADDVEAPGPPVKYVYKKRRRNYYPDFYIAKTNTLIEVKSSWTMQRNKKMNAAKWKAARLHGYTMIVIVYDAKGSRVQAAK